MKILKESLQNDIKKKISNINNDRQQWLADNYVSNLAINWRNFYYDTTTRRTITEQNIYAPILKRFFNSVKNIVTSNEYKWSLKDTWTTEDFSENDKLVAQALLDYAYDENNFNVLDDIIVSDILKYFFSLIYVDYKNNKTEIKVINPMDVFIEKNEKTTSWIYDWEYIIFFEKTTKDNIRNKYWINFDTTTYKDLYENVWVEADTNWQTYRYMYYFYKKDWKIYWYKSVWEYIVEEYTNLDIYPISIIKAQEEDYNIYWTSLSTLIAPIWQKLQKAYNVISKHLDWYWKRIFFQKKWWVLAVRWLSDTMSELANVDAIIEHTWETPQTYQPPQIDNSFTYIQQILDVAMQNSVWVHNATLWTVEWRSGIQMAQAQQWDKQNIIDMIQNYKEWIQGLAKIILYLYSNKLDIDLVLEYEWLNLRVIWQKEYALLDSIWVDVSWLMPIKFFSRLEVEIIPWDFFTQSYLTNKLIELKSMWIPIPDEVLLQSIKTWDVGMLLRKYDLLQEQETQKDPDIDIAQWENKKLWQGSNVAVNTTDKHKVHIIIHSELLKQIKEAKQQEVLLQLQQQGIKPTDEVLQNLTEQINNDKIVKLIQQHIDDHNTMLQWEEWAKQQNNLLANL